MFMRVSWILITTAFSATGLHAGEHDEFFEARVRPLLAKRCYECHRRKAEGGLRLDSRAAMLAGGQSGPAIVPGDVEKSLLWQVVAKKHAEISMPPDEPLKEGEVKVLANWIADGAHWPDAVPSARAVPDGYGITDEEREFWSFQPIVRHQPPPADGVPNAHPVDAFIADGYRQQGLVAGEQLMPRALIRRVTYDLIGLPPTAQDIVKFERASADDPEAAWRNLVDRLLASRHYGERWGQHWLDLVRYADTAGDAADFPVPEAYKYRNYVIDAFNDDKPYDQFVREQLAGDLLPVDSDEDETWRRVIATGYIAISRRIGVSPHGQRHITIEDTLNNLGRTFLGLSIGCARCHDHKFDPIPTADYYALYGIFDSTVYPHAGAEHRPYRGDFVYRVGKEESDRILTDYRDTLDARRKEERAAFERYRDFQRKPINTPGYTRDVAWHDVLDVRDEIRKVAETFPDLETAFAVGEGDSGDVPIQKQGDPRDRGKVVRRGFLQVLGGQTLPDGIDQSGRLQLAEWITNPDNPLTARVMANRVWHHHFGRGLVATTSDFGVRGDRPSHPRLLDYLAGYLIDHGWSVKQLHRLILGSRTYRLSSRDVPANSDLDPDNVFLWRGNRRRLDAEQLRDSILVLSDQLDRSPGEAHPFPHRLTYFYRQHEPFVGDFPSNRRTVYLFRQRIRKNRYLDLFDGTDGNLHVGTRRPTTTTLQSLFFMNSPFIEEQSAAIAGRVVDSGSTREQRVVWAWTKVFGREVTDEEARMADEYLDRLQQSVADDVDDGIRMAWIGMIRAMLSSNEFLYVD